MEQGSPGDFDYTPVIPQGIIDSPGRLHERCEYYIKDFGYNAEEASAVIAMLLDEVFNIKPENITLQIKLFGCDNEGEGGGRK